MNVTFALRTLRRIARAGSCAALLLGAAGCGGDSAGESTAGEGPITDSVSPRAERLARTAAELEAHARELERQGIGPRLVEGCRDLLETSTGDSYFIRAGYGFHAADVRLLVSWNVPERSGAGDAGRKRRGFDGLVALTRRLRERGIELVLVPIPRTLQIYPERIIADLELPADFVGADPATTAYLAELTEAGVEVVHLTPVFAAQRVSGDEQQDRHLYHDYNSHWTARAVRLAADRVAERVVELEGYEPGSLREGVDWQVVHRKILFKVPPPRGMNLPEVKVETGVWVDAILDEQGRRALRPLRSSPILFVGDSNSQWYQKDFASLPDQLMARLGQRLDVIAIPGLPADGAWKLLERRKPGETLGEKRIIVWVFELNMLLDEELAELERFVE